MTDEQRCDKLMNLAQTALDSIKHQAIEPLAKARIEGKPLSNHDVCFLMMKIAERVMAGQIESVRLSGGNTVQSTFDVLNWIIDDAQLGHQLKVILLN